MNMVTLAYALAHDLQIGPVWELQEVKDKLPIQGVAGYCTGPLGYAIMWVRTDGLPSYNEDKVSIIVDDVTAYSRQVPVILGTLTINRVVMSMKEGEMEKSPPKWHYSHRSYKIANNLFIAMVGAPYEDEEGMLRLPTNTAQNPATLDEKVKLKSKFTIPAFGILIVHGRTECTTMMDRKL